MSNVRELFTNLEKLQRTKRGQKPKMIFVSAPTLDIVMGKLCDRLIDTYVKNEVVKGGTAEVRRCIFRSGTNYGYLCVKSNMFPTHLCKSVVELQKMYDLLFANIKWYTSKEIMIYNVKRVATSIPYLDRLERVVNA